MSETYVTLITGTSRGIGKALASHYLQCGHFVIGCSRSEPDLIHPRYEHMLLDVCNEQAAMKVFSDIKTKHGKLDHLINNAGIGLMNHSLLTPLSAIEKIFKTNTFAAFLFSREAARIMQKGKFGRIVNITTVAVPLKLEGESGYAASKAALISLTEILAREYAQFGITVNSVGPSAVQTDLIRSVPADKIDKLLERQAIKRFCEMEDIANAVDFFLRKESSFITGQHLFLGGV